MQFHCLKFLWPCSMQHNMLHVINAKCVHVIWTQMHPGHLNVHVEDRLWRRMRLLFWKGLTLTELLIKFGPWNAPLLGHGDHITNEEVTARIGNAIGPYEDLLTSVKRRKLKWYGHTTRSSGLANTILRGTVQGGRQRGRQRKRWKGNMKEWTGLEWNNLLRKAKNREEKRKLVVKSTVVPQQSARL